MARIEPIRVPVQLDVRDLETQLAECMRLAREFTEASVKLQRAIVVTTAQVEDLRASILKLAEIGETQS